MSEVMNLMGEARQTGSPRNANPTGMAGQVPPTTERARRPAFVTFAALILLLMGGFSLVWAHVRHPTVAPAQQ